MKGDQIDREGWSVPLKYTRGISEDGENAGAGIESDNTGEYSSE